MDYKGAVTVFQSAPPLRVETMSYRATPWAMSYFNPRHPQRTAAFLLRYTQFFDLRGVVPSDGLQSGDFGLDFFHVLRHLV